jgi:hypothetical protein
MASDRREYQRELMRKRRAAAKAASRADAVGERKSAIEAALNSGDLTKAEEELKAVAVAGPSEMRWDRYQIEGQEVPADAPEWDWGPTGYDPVDDVVARGVREAGVLHQLLAPKRPKMSEADYVELSLKQAAPLVNRVRAERYARWRYRGYCAGIVASL